MLGHERDICILGSGAACRLPCYGVQDRIGDEGKSSFHSSHAGYKAAVHMLHYYKDSAALSDES